MTGRGEQLLAIQDEDLAIDRLNHRRDTLPERALLADAAKRGVELDGELAEATARLAEISERQARLEEELAATESRSADLERRLYSGTVTASRELVSMSEESDHLKQRRSNLEDELLELLDAREPHDALMAELAARREELVAEAERLLAAIAAEEHAIDEEVARQTVTRAQLFAAFADTELLANYERLRKRLGGVGAARLVGNACSGCHLELSAQEVDRLRRLPPDQLESCEQCGRILVP
jgi:predicted  nucleic acid-binding Zn-ribbon protein